uniref:Uncharacterized protein n=1 Tax=Panagrolaimus davidi TaxID=227884 RepID=A0A914Q414_9BILA
MVEKAVDMIKKVHAIKHKRYAHLIEQKQRAGKLVVKKGMIKKAKTKVHMLRAPVVESESEREKEEVMETN